jgi:hypothetical protein
MHPTNASLSMASSSPQQIGPAAVDVAELCAALPRRAVATALPALPTALGGRL